MRWGRERGRKRLLKWRLGVKIVVVDGRDREVVEVRRTVLLPLLLLSLVLMEVEEEGAKAGGGEERPERSVRCRMAKGEEAKAV